VKSPDVIVQGKDDGEGMVIQYKTARGTRVLGLAVPNIRVNVNWNLGPTWCYLILGEKITLIDTGREGNLEVFNTLMRSLGKSLSDIDRIIVTHSHEDHDGNLAEIISAGKAELWAYPIYRQMIYYHPEIEDGAQHPEMPGSCRVCFMPEKIYKNCLSYHQKRSRLHVDFDIREEQLLPDDGLGFVFTPGHSPDSICIILENEVIFTGDTILPDITPHPSLKHYFKANRRILPEEYRDQNAVYGLMTYLKSLNKVVHLDSQPLQATFPAHRLFYNGRFNFIDSSARRAVEIVQFHIDRCRDILNIIDSEPATLEQIAVQHFPPSMLRGQGTLLAVDEIRAHVEVMEELGDVRWTGEEANLLQRTGSDNYVTAMGAYLR
jgi:glyoxylase-like metal-dependent hydrolase (beta-lactamase superfamily II)